MLQPKSFFTQILKRFPACELSVAYGSGVFQQLGYAVKDQKVAAKDAPMLDMILAVRNPAEWHAENMHRNHKDYTWPLSWCTGSTVGHVQELGGAHMLYHPYIDVSALTGHNQQLKYGVISVRHLEEDLAYWNTLFCAGRLHKPIALLDSTPELDHLMRQNLRSALYTSLLLLPSRFSERDVYVQITGLSYAGDVRFLIGAESASKVTNIVDANLLGFQSLYRPLLTEIKWLTRVEREEDSGVWEYERVASEEHIVNLVNSLPANFRRTLPRSPHEIADLLVVKKDMVSVQNTVTKGLHKIVRGVAGVQQAKNLLSAGVSKSANYIKAKWSKGKQSRSQSSSSPPSGSSTFKTKVYMGGNSTKSHQSPSVSVHPSSGLSSSSSSLSSTADPSVSDSSLKDKQL